MPSFDIVSKVEFQEVRNAVDNAKKEIITRYDFKDSKSSIELKDEMIILVADDKLKLTALQEILKLKLSKRNVSLKSVEFKDSKPAGGDTIRQEVIVKQGLTDEEQKKITKAVKGTKSKVNTQIQADQVRVTGKKRDDLQEVIAFLRGEIKDIDLQFVNFRE